MSLKPKPDGFPKNDMALIRSPRSDVIFSKPAAPVSRSHCNNVKWWCLGERWSKEPWVTQLMMLENGKGKSAEIDIKKLMDRPDD